MRTNLTLDDDLAARLRKMARRRGITFKEAVNSVLRRGLSAPERGGRRVRPFRVRTFRSPFQPGVDPLKLNQLSGEVGQVAAWRAALPGRAFLRMAGAARGTRSLSTRKGFRKP